MLEDALAWRMIEFASNLLRSSPFQSFFLSVLIFYWILLSFLVAYDNLLNTTRQSFQRRKLRIAFITEVSQWHKEWLCIMPFFHEYWTLSMINLRVVNNTERLTAHFMIAVNGFDFALFAPRRFFFWCTYHRN